MIKFFYPWINSSEEKAAGKFANENAKKTQI